MHIAGIKKNMEVAVLSKHFLKFLITINRIIIKTKIKTENFRNSKCKVEIFTCFTVFIYV